jgi:hypothetical protein
MSSIMEDFKNKVAEISEDNEYWGDIDSFDLEAPFQLPTVQQPNESEWRFSVPFDDWNVDYWYSDSTAIFFGKLEFASNPNIDVEICPSMGEGQQWESGLIGAGSILVPVKAHKRKSINGSVYESESLKVSFGGVDPIWSRQQRELPYNYRDDLKELNLEWDQAIAMKFPTGFNTPKVIWGCEAISYALGYCALVYGLKSMVANIDQFNKYLTKETI